MSHNRFTPYIFLLAALLPSQYILSDETANQSMTAHITAHYLFATFGEEKIAAPVVVDENESFMEKYNKELDPKKEILNSREIQKIAFDLTAAHKTFESTVIDSSCIDKLKIIGGGEHSQQHLLGSIFKNINTAMGTAHAALTFCHPTTDTSILLKRQKAIDFLTKTDITAIDKALAKIKNCEEKSYMFWSSKSPVNTELSKNLYFGQAFDYRNILKSLNTNTIALESTNKLFQLGQIAFGTLYVPTVIGINFYQIAAQSNMTCTELYTKIRSELPKVLAQMPEIPLHYKALAIVAIGLPIGGQGLLAYNAFRSLQSTLEISNHLQDILITTNTHIKQLRILSSQLNKNKELLHYLPSLQPLADFNNPKKRSAKLNKLLGMLDTNTFTGKASFLSITGRVLAAYELVKQIKDEVAPAMVAAGELDMYVTLAKLYKAQENKNARYCMVHFAADSTTPIIDAHNFWNPFINPDTVVTNSITFDPSCPNSILTGPNTGGKSTVIGAIMINVLMAQTFGIAPSESLIITPFTKLNCFMNISDDIATGASLFASEVMRAKKLLEMVQSLQENEFSFVIIDEVFTGTSPVEGERAALAFAKKLGSYHNGLNIIATHYPKMVDLDVETNGLFCNHHVEILRNDDNSLNRTFKLKTGPSFFNVAFDILAEEGLVF